MTNEEIFATKKLASAIVTQAVTDWRNLEKEYAYNQKYNGLRRFFKSEWCDWLCSEVGIDAKMILDKLESERKSRPDEM